RVAEEGANRAVWPLANRQVEAFGVVERNDLAPPDPILCCSQLNWGGIATTPDMFGAALDPMPADLVSVLDQPAANLTSASRQGKSEQVLLDAHGRLKARDQSSPIRSLSDNGELASNLRAKAPLAAPEPRQTGHRRISRLYRLTRWRGWWGLART